MTRRTRDDEGDPWPFASLPTSGKNITMSWVYIKNVGEITEETRLKR
jgi:hypothetical protein